MKLKGADPTSMRLRSSTGNRNLTVGAREGSFQLFAPLPVKFTVLSKLQETWPTP